MTSRPTLLHIDSSPRRAMSISRQLTAEYVTQWKRANPEGAIRRRDLSGSDLPLLTGEWINASFTPEVSRTAEQRELLRISDTLVAELQAADEYVIGVPMHNFTIAASLRLWIDQIVRVGETFAYVDGLPTGLLKNKRATFVISTGGVYQPGTSLAACDFVEPYLRAIFGFMGVADLHAFTASGAAAVTSGRMDAATFLRPHFESIRQHFVPMATASAS
ncbi:NAD(P)H dehydrogenase (quinone) [Chthoniobacter flavus Ellin428]|uniref:FMN dependent NADH:quinone oxidoreductase n=1 Tax=Chthoniobacter flavus Ellin428 TaxID=497964 RepID=B4CUJ7_9BACT|nr:NAD(P)H-dependent oxidoreductase [Chthoniobacter flavus]EDY22235.1 NAD(P)H dehydrogenase (quinone) [Chthoniobacter flavus Ellin428]TCO94740.1 FMN-dependent NADH-azoreductase [Chthoniobacter flavus]